MKHTHLLLSLLTCIITGTTSNAMLAPRFMALLSRTLSHGPAQSACLSTKNNIHTDLYTTVFRLPETSTADQQTQRALNNLARTLANPNFSTKKINEYAQTIHRHGLVSNLLSYALYLARNKRTIEQTYGQLIDQTLQHAAPDDHDYVNEQLWDKNNMRKGSWQAFALHEAAECGLTNISKVLLKHKADVSLKGTWHKGTALHYAQNADIASMLIKNKAPVNAQDLRGNTPLHKAKTSVIRLLLEAGADISIGSHHPIDLIRYRCTWENYEYDKPIPHHPDELTEQLLTLIHAYNNNIRDLENKELPTSFQESDRGISYHIWSYYDPTPPMWAAYCGNYPALEAFLTHADSTALAKQLGAVQLIATCNAVHERAREEYDGNYTKFLRLLDEYKKKHDLL